MKEADILHTIDPSQKIIDFHAHVFPQPIAQKATDNVGSYYGLRMQAVGMAEQLLARAAGLNMLGFVVHSSATKAAQVEKVNDFIAGLVRENPVFIGFGTIHKDYENPEREIQRCMTLGLRGLKLHPDFQHFELDQKEMFPIYQIASDLGLPILFHVGDKNTDASSPTRVRRVLDLFPRLKVIAAHMGGYSAWDEAMECLYGRNVYFDTSSTMIVLPHKKVREMIYRHGIEKILFGSDFPIQTTPAAAMDIEQLGLPSADKDLVYHQNAERLLSAK